MKVMKLIRLALRNFKGIRNFVLGAEGEDVKVFGDNATGKTTLMDGFLWLLFNKDSQGKTTFEIKTLNEDNQVLHGLEHEVEAIFEVNGRHMKLRKVYMEKWTKKRGSVEQEFTGHTTDYFIDDVPVKLKEFNDEVSAIIDEDVFKLLTSPTYFNEQIDKKKRRDILMTVCGDITDEDVIASSKALAQLPEILAGKTIEKHRAMIGGRMKDINEELKKIPIRIDEVYRSLPDTSGLNEAELQQQIDSLKEQMDDKQAEITRIQSGGEITAKQNRLREIEGELIEIRNRVNEESSGQVSAQRQIVSQLTREIEDLGHDIKSKERRVHANDEDIRDKQAKAEGLRAEFRREDAKQFEHHQDENCPTCKQALPADQLQATHDKALADFNRQKAERLESINAKGQAIVKQIAQLQEDNKALQEQLNELNTQMKSKSAELEQAQAKQDDLQLLVRDATDDPVYMAKRQEMSTIEEEIQQLRASVQDALAKVRDEISTLRRETDQLEQDKAKFGHVKVAMQRIQSLEEQQKQLATEYEELERQVFLTEEFIRTKVSLLEEMINGKFQYARFKLFKQNINGGVEEDCETLYKGVPYSGGLNNAARINVGLDIISTLSEHYGMLAPIFVDNSEAVTKLIEMDAQVIALVVSEADKQLRVESKAYEKEAV